MTPHEPDNKQSDIKETIRNMAKKSIHTASNDTTLDNVNLSSITQAFESTMQGFIQSISQTMQEYKTAIDEMGGFYEVMKTAWNIEEETVAVLTLETVIAWTQHYFDPAVHSGACLIGTPKEKKYHLLFLDKDSKPMLDGSQRHKIFYVKTIDHDLKVQLADKHMLVLK